MRRPAGYTIRESDESERRLARVGRETGIKGDGSGVYYRPPSGIAGLFRLGNGHSDMSMCDEQLLSAIEVDIEPLLLPFTHLPLANVVVPLRAQCGHPLWQRA